MNSWNDVSSFLLDGLLRQSVGGRLGMVISFEGFTGILLRTEATGCWPSPRP